VRVFVSEAVLPRLQVGQKVHGMLDAIADRDFAGTITNIAPNAEFTPRVALTERERADLVFGVKVEFADTTGMLKAGLPITVRIEAPVPARAP
jgi:HlyD family secretion protein